MGFSSQPGVTAFRTQSARGVVATDLETDGVAVRLTEGSMGGNRELLIPDPEIGGNRDIPDALLGPVSFGGDYGFYMRFNSVATFLKGALGEVATTGDGTATPFTHTFTPSDSSALPFLSIYEEISSGLERMMYTDCVINTFHLEADAASYLTGTVGVIGAKQTQGVADIDVSDIYDNSQFTVGTNIKVLYNSIDVKAKSFSLDINNNFEDDDFRLGSFFLEDMTPKRREVTASMTLRHESSAMMRQALLGTSAATTAGGITTKLPLVIEIKSYENIPGVSPVAQYSLTFTIPKVIFEPFAFEPSGDDILESDVSMQAVRPDNATPILTAVLKNSIEDIA